MEFLSKDAPNPQKALTCVIKGAEIFIPMAGLVDVDMEIERLNKEHKNLIKEIERVNKKCKTKVFRKGTKRVVDKERAKTRLYGNDTKSRAKAKDDAGNKIGLSL